VTLRPDSAIRTGHWTDRSLFVIDQLKSFLRLRLSRAGNRRLNHVLYMAGIVQLRNDTAGRAYYRRKLAAGKTSMEAMRCLRRRLSDAVYRQLAADARGEASPGGHPGASLISSAAGLSPDTGTSDQPVPLQNSSHGVCFGHS
jgi:transposase